MSAKKMYVCTVTLPDGKAVVATACSESLDDDVHVEWSGVTDRFGPVLHGKYSVDFLRWYLEAKSQRLGGQFEFKVNGQGAP